MRIAEVKQTERPRYGMTATGYGSAVPTSYMVRLDGDPRWRRVYCTICSNVGTCWVRIKGKKHVVDGCAPYDGPELWSIDDTPWRTPAVSFDEPYQVIVANVGTVLRTESEEDARREFNSYRVALRDGEAGRAEAVVLLHHGEILDEYQPPPISRREIQRLTSLLHAKAATATDNELLAALFDVAVRHIGRVPVCDEMDLPDYHPLRQDGATFADPGEN